MFRIKSQPCKLIATFFTLVLILTGSFMNADYVTATSKTSSVNDFYFDDFVADYYLSRDEDGTSRLRVVETLTAIFPDFDQNYGITRTIPYTNQDGKNLTMASDQNLEIRITHNGVPEKPYKIENGDGYFSVYLGSTNEFVHGMQTYTLEYEFENVITDFDEDGLAWQELYWDTNGNDWQQTFNSLTARVHLVNSEIVNNVNGDPSCYVGAYGISGSERCQVLHSEDGFEFRAYSLRNGENLTFDLTFDPGTFASAKLKLDFRLVVTLIIEIIFAGAIIVYLFSARKKVTEKRKFYKNLFIKPEYTAPKNLSVAEMTKNYLHGSTISHGKFFTATLMEMAISGKVEIIKDEEDKKRFGRKHDTWKIRLKTTNFTPAEKDLLKVLNGGIIEPKIGEDIDILDRPATSGIVSANRDFFNQVLRNLRTAGLYEVNTNPAKKKHFKPVDIIAGLAMAWLFVGLITIMFLLESTPSYRIIIGGSAMATFIILFWIAMFIIMIITALSLDPYFVHTKKGLEYSRYMDGLKLYIKMAESDRIKVLQSAKGADVSHQGIVKIYEKLLPYAITLGFEKTWFEEMGRYYEFNDVKSPNWYAAGVTAFNAHEFSRALNSVSNSVTTSTTHSASSGSSSSHSGSGGRGFSGGGGGGGGGGGW